MKSVSEIRDMIQLSSDYSPRTAGIFEVVEALLEHISMLHADVADCDKRIGNREKSEASVPARWYRASVHAHMKVYRELLALGEAVNEHEKANCADPQIIRRHQREILAADSEYQRLLAEDSNKETTRRRQIAGLLKGLVITCNSSPGDAKVEILCGNDLQRAQAIHSYLVHVKDVRTGNND